MTAVGVSLLMDRNVKSGRGIFESLFMDIRGIAYWRFLVEFWKFWRSFCFANFPSAYFLLCGHHILAFRQEGTWGAKHMGISIWLDWFGIGSSCISINGNWRHRSEIYQQKWFSLAHIFGEWP